MPLPETSYVHWKVCVDPPASTVPPAGGGEVATVAAAVPVTATVGAGRASSRRPAPPGFSAVNVSVARCSPADTRAGLAAADSVSCPGFCTCTVALVTLPVEGVLLLSFASVPCALETKETWPAEVPEVVQLNDALAPACSTVTGPAAMAVIAAVVAVAPEATVGVAAVTLLASAPPVFCTVSVRRSI